MNDIRPPRRPDRPPTSAQPVVTPQPPQTSVPQVAPLEAISSPSPTKPRRKRRWPYAIVAIVVMIIAVVIAAFLWYQSALQPAKPSDDSRQRIEITTGLTPQQIASLLEEKQLIRSATAFDLYTRLTGTGNSLKAGLYSLSPSESTSQIVAHLQKGSTEEVRITFLPGATIADHKRVLQEAGYSSAEIDTGFAKQYTHELLKDKPADADLEGYIYGETYAFSVGASVETILTRTFDEFLAALKEKSLQNGIPARNLTLHQAITFASVVQREEKEPTKQQQVAGVFINRLRASMTLGSDPTYIYAAKKLGVPATPSLDSPYNTRKYPGLPPGPIASPNITALEAIVMPIESDYLFFLSGDDDKLYFARTDAEHQSNISNHCSVKCFSY